MKLIEVSIDQAWKCIVRPKNMYAAFGLLIPIQRPSRSMLRKVRPMNGQDNCAPDRGVGGFREFDPFSNKCANCWVLRSSLWRLLAGRFGGLLEVNLEVVELSCESLGGVLGISPGS